MSRWMVVTVMLAGATLPASVSARQEVPTVFEAGHFYATPTLATGQRLRLVVDTGGGGGGGWFVFGHNAVSRLGLITDRCRLEEGDATVVPSLAFQPGKGLPASASTPCHAIALVLPGDGPIDGEDGQLGAGYLPGHIWTFDYPAQKLWLENSRWKPAATMHAAELHFPHDARGRPQGGFARITLTIEGQPFDFLLDTGATAHPTDAAKATAASLSEHGVGVASYVTTTVLERWHREHPSWRIIPHGDDLLGARFDSRLIEVPDVEIAGWHVGPVWFTERPDEAFGEAHGGMSSYMDQPVVGAIGGNVFRHFAMTLDYPAARAWFACAEGCRSTETSRR